MKEIQVSLYEIFGYLIPGVVAVGASLIVYWTFFVSTPFVLAHNDGNGWWLALFGSYLAGHLVQSLANIVLCRRTNISLVLESGSKLSMPVEILNEAKRFAASLVGLKTSGKLPASSVYEICDAYVQQKGINDSREVFVYREGFYRGLFMSMALLSATLFLRAFCANSEVVWFGVHHEFTWSELVFLAVISGSASWLFFRRFRRFGKYLLSHGIYSALVIRASASNSSAHQEGPLDD